MLTLDVVTEALEALGILNPYNRPALAALRASLQARERGPLDSPPTAP